MTHVITHNRPTTTTNHPRVTSHEPQATNKCAKQTQFPKHQNLHNLSSCKDLRKQWQILPFKSKPKQTQSNPIRPPFFARQRPPNQKHTQTNPIYSEPVEPTCSEPVESIHRSPPCSPAQPKMVDKREWSGSFLDSLLACARKNVLLDAKSKQDATPSFPKASFTPMLLAALPPRPASRSAHA